MRLDYGAIADLQTYVDAMPSVAANAAKLALNDVAAGSGLAAYRSAIESGLDYPAGYVNGDRLFVESRATTTRLSVSIVGRDRPTSLARFVQLGNAPGKYGVTVRVKKGGASRLIKRGFLLSLRNGNRGLAVRLRPGETLQNSVGAKRLRENVYLLYGPSVNQAFAEIVPQETPAVLDKVAAEFYRQFFRLIK